MSNNTNFEHIPQEKFRFVQMDAQLHDKRLETKSRSFFQDALLRFSKNKSSVVAAWILAFLVLFALVSPLLSPYSINDKDKLYINYPSYVPSIAKLHIGIMDGGKVHSSQNETSMNYWKGIAQETGMDPVLGVVKENVSTVKYRGQMVERKTYDLNVNRYFELGIVYRVFSYAEFQRIQDWQDETGIQVIYPYVDPADIGGSADTPNIWYQVDGSGSAILDADVFISLTHFKGHESTGFGGALKNIGMGCGSRAGKMEQHAAGKPAVQEGLCRGCHRCAKECGSDAITYNAENKAVIDYDKCKGCGRCIGACSFDAIYSPNDCANELLDRKMAEYAAAVCHDRPCFHISLVQDISPNCDCHGENDAPILPDIGIFASFDPVALDQACADACLNAQPLPNSQLGQNLAKPGWNCHHDNFKDSNPNIEWKATLEQAEKIGMGTRQYVLKKV